MIGCTHAENRLQPKQSKEHEEDDPGDPPDHEP